MSHRPGLIMVTLLLSFLTKTLEIFATLFSQMYLSAKFATGSDLSNANHEPFYILCTQFSLIVASVSVAAI